MNITDLTLEYEEKAVFALRSLYSKYGYSQYKMNKFEEYDLYVKNKDFLISDSVITFTDTNGRLMALKPDVTLSIIKNSKDTKGYVEKLYYNEISDGRYEIYDEHENIITTVEKSQIKAYEENSKYNPDPLGEFSPTLEWFHTF